MTVHSTPPGVTQALLRERPPMHCDTVLLEPFAGHGAIIKEVISQPSFNAWTPDEVYACEIDPDLENDIRGTVTLTGVPLHLVISDFLLFEVEKQWRFDLGEEVNVALISNPPWSPAETMFRCVRTCLELKCSYTALLLPNGFPHVPQRAELLKQYPCSYHPLTPRPLFPHCTNQYNCGWYVWDDRPQSFEPWRWR